MEIIMTAISERQRAHFYIYKKQKNAKLLYIQKARHFTLRTYSWKFWSWHLYKKTHSNLRDVKFLYTKSRHFAKSRKICITFLYTKTLTLCVTRFLLNFWNWRRWRDILICKKQCTMRHIFISKKQRTLRYVFISEIYRIVLIPKYKRTYNHSDQIEK